MHTGRQGTQATLEPRQARERFLAAIRAARSLDIPRLASAFQERGEPLLSGFRALLELHESDPRSHEQLAGLIGEFDAQIEARLATLARELPDHRYYTMQDVIAGRGYRRVHTTALGAGALMMWGDFQGQDRTLHWRHGIATGILASLAVGNDAVQRDRAFPAGLLHDLGRLSLAAAPESRSNQWSGAPLVTDMTGRSVAAELDFPAWLSDALFTCELGPRDGNELESVIATACATAAQLGYETAPVALRGTGVRELRGALDRVGGRKWLHARIEAMQLAAQGHLVVAFVDTWRPR